MKVLGNFRRLLGEVEDHSFWGIQKWEEEEGAVSHLAQDSYLTEQPRGLYPGLRTWHLSAFQKSILLKEGSGPY